MDSVARICRKIVFSIICVGLMIGVYRINVDAGSVSDNMVVVIAWNSENETVGVANGVLIMKDNGSTFVATASANEWNEASKITIEGPEIEETEVVVSNNDSVSGICILKTDIESMGYSTSYMVGMNEMFSGQVLYQGGLDWDLDGNSWSDTADYSDTLLVSSYETDDYNYMKMLNDFRGNFIGGGVYLDDGRLLGIMVSKENENNYFMPIETVLSIAQSGSNISGLGQSTADMFFICLIPVFIILFIGSTIFYINKENKRKTNREEEFLNVLILGGEAGLRLKGEGGAFNDVRFPLEERVVFGRDSSQCYAVYPDETKGISRKHCSVEIKNGTLILMDLGSTYGTFLGNGIRLTPNKPYNLQFGDTFYLVDPINTFRVI